MSDRRHRLNRHGIRLTPEAACYARDLVLTRWGRGRTVAAWVEDNGQQPSIALRLVRDNGRVGPVRRIMPIAGLPTALRLLPPDRAVWIEFTGGTGRLVWARFDVLADCPATAEVVLGAVDENVGDVACCVGPDGMRWFLIESRTPDSRLLLGRSTSGSGRLDVSVLRKDAFFARPRLVAGPETVMASWDEYAAGHYGVHTLDILRSPAGSSLLPKGGDDNETLSALTRAEDGAWFAARCRERLVELDGGVASHHSEIVVAVRKSDVWTDVAWIDIDHGLNPWMAGYTGARRFPHVLGGSDHVAVLWEEKEDARTMDPAPARFCAAKVGSDGLRGALKIAVTDVSNLVVEKGGKANAAWLASKTQTYHNEQHLPWCLHRFNADLTHQPRPEGLESNRDARVFQVRAPRPNTAVPPDQPLRLFFGDPHLHSRLSGDVDGEQDELYHFARDIAHLDFCAFCENDFHRLIEPMSSALWENNLRNAEYFNQPDIFTVLVGWEYTKHAEPERRDPIPNSHRCVLFPDREGQVYHYWCNGIQTPSPRDLCTRFHGRRVLLHHHHEPGFDFTDDTLERNIEICSGWGVHMASSAFRDALHRLLGRGFKVGFFAASDNHERNPGLGGALTGVWAQENTRAGIFDAFWSRRVFATTGIRPDLQFWVAGAFMGQSISVADAPVVRIAASADRLIERIDIIRDGTTVHEEAPCSRQTDIEWADVNCPAGDHFYYAHVKFSGEEYNPYWNIANAYGVNAWTSPVWVKRC